MFIAEPQDTHHHRYLIVHADHRPLDVTYSQARALQLASAGDVITKQDTVRHDNGNFEYLPAIPDGWK
jgi:hypothetical protein